MTYDTLIFIQNTAKIFYTVCLLAGAAHLIAGLIKPQWVWLTKRRWVVGRTLLVWVAGLIVVGGTIAYTHGHPNGPHAFNSYMKDYIAADCAAGKPSELCEELKQQCSKPTTFPACETYHAARKKLGLE